MHDVVNPYRVSRPKYDSQSDSYVCEKRVPSDVEPAFDDVGFMMAYEDGELDRDEIVAGFQHLINSGLASKLQGSYGRTAANLIDSGHCIDPYHAVASIPGGH